MEDFHVKSNEQNTLFLGDILKILEQLGIVWNELQP
jgi:hypothetical protein